MSITLAFIKKEFLQIIRDPSSLIIAFVLPTLLLFIYAYGINLDLAAAIGCFLSSALCFCTLRSASG